MSSTTLKDLFIDELQDVYDAEARITRALPKMKEAANSQRLVIALDEYLSASREHLIRLDRLFEMFDVSPSHKTCKAMAGVLEEGEQLMKHDGTTSVRDAALIAAAQKVEHYEMATYGCLRTWAHQMGEGAARDLLQQNLDEAGAADHLLTEIAMDLNVEAISGADERRERGARGLTESQRDDGREGGTRSLPRRPEPPHGRWE